ncbi:MAG: hypothetical protein P4L87_21470 [Formivibrio sp.]|nr:hypothetical protein [Formivibrio sp.]
MLTYLVLFITAYLVFKILRAQRSADATGYLLVSGLIPLPMYIIGRGADAGIFPIDVCLLAYFLAHGRHAFGYFIERRALAGGIGALFGFSVLATYSGIFNFIFIDPSALKFYAFTIVKFWEYALLAVLLIASRPDSAQLRRICVIVIGGILIYEILHVLHISGIVPLSGEGYFGARAADAQVGESPFTDKTGWFLTSYRVVIGGTASISAWLSLMIFEAYRGRIKAVAAATAILSVFSVLATSSRSDIVGLAVGAFVFAVLAPARRWGVYASAAVASAVLYAALLAFFLPPVEKASALDRMSELWNPQLRVEGDYADRSFDRARLLSYLPEHPRELLIGAGPGNFHWYNAKGITKNFFGHNSYLHWTGELGIGGLLLLLAWCISVFLFLMKRLRSRSLICQLAARTCLALVIGRMVAAWGAESLFGTEGMGSYSLFFVGVVYLLLSVASGMDVTDNRLLGHFE